MDTDKGTIYTMVILLSDRTHFSGGEIFVKKVRDGEEEVCTLNMVIRILLCSIVLLFYCSVVLLLSCFITAGVLESPSLLSPYSSLAISLHNTIHHTNNNPSFYIFLHLSTSTMLSG